MSIVKVLEVIAESDQSWEHATKLALEKAAESVHGIKAVYVKDMKAMVKDNKITAYRVNAKISFELD